MHIRPYIDSTLLIKKMFSLKQQQQQQQQQQKYCNSKINLFNLNSMTSEQSHSVILMLLFKTCSNFPYYSSIIIETYLRHCFVLLL